MSLTETLTATFLATITGQKKKLKRTSHDVNYPHGIHNLSVGN